MNIRLAIVEKICEGDEETDVGPSAEIAVRNSPSSNFHGSAVIVYASDLTELIERVNTILDAFNKEE